MTNQHGQTRAGRVVAFCHQLRGQGIGVTPQHSLAAVEGLDWIDETSDEDVYYTLRSTLISKHEDYAQFDEAFQRYWLASGRPLPREKSSSARVEGQPPTSRPGGASSYAGWHDSPDQHEARILGKFSEGEILREKDFSEITENERRAIEGSINKLEWNPRRWISKRLTSSSKIRSLDMRTTMRKSMRSGGEALKLFGSDRKLTTPTIVVLVDVSGSMDRYARMLLHLLHHLHKNRGAKPETFLFGTRLTRATRIMRERDVESAISKVGKKAKDLSGGTRIGAALKEFNFNWSRRVLGGKAIAIIISDGLDRGNLGMLSDEMARLQRNCHRLIWLNPLMSDGGFQPEAGGMAAALPYIDDFLPVHNLKSLEILGEKLKSLPASKPVRRQTSPILDTRAVA